MGIGGHDDCHLFKKCALHQSGALGRPRLVAFIHIPRPRRRSRLDGKRGGPRPAMDALVRAGGAILADLVAQASV